MRQMKEVLVTKESGIVGDFRGGGGMLRRRQVTVISFEQWQEACREIGYALPTFSRRANVCITGHSFGPEDEGKLIRFPDVTLEITGETKPCHRMDDVSPGLRKALTPNWRGGVTCRVIKGGILKRDQRAELV